MHDVIVAGHVCLDLVPRVRTPRFLPGQLLDVGPMAVSLGGTVSNTGRALVALGHSVACVTRVGDDPLGRLTAQLLSESGIEGEPLLADGAESSYSIVIEPEGQDRCFWHYAGANMRFDGTETIAPARIIHLGYPSLLPGLLTDNAAPLRSFLERVRATDAVTSVDLAVVPDSSQHDWRSILRGVMPLVDVISPSADDLRSAFDDPTATAESLTDLLIEWGAGIAAVSDGAQGVSVRGASRDRLGNAGAAVRTLADTWADARVHRDPAPLERRATTNGAGDASTAGLLSALLQGFGPVEAATLAAETAARAIEGRLLS